MRQRARLIVLAGCLILLATVARLWVRSYEFVDQLRVDVRNTESPAAVQASAPGMRRNYSLQLQSRPGRLSADWMTVDAFPVAGRPPSPAWNLRTWSTAMDYDVLARTTPVWGWGGFSYVNHKATMLTWGTTDVHIRRLTIPTWFPLVVFLLPWLAWAATGTRRRRRRERGLCVACGYDLRASPERCPECGLAA